MTSLLKEIFHLHPWVCLPQMLHILPKKVRNEQREQHFSRGKTIKATIKVMPCRESHVIFTAGKRLLWSFWPRNARSSKKSRLNCLKQAAFLDKGQSLQNVSFSRCEMRLNKDYTLFTKKQHCLLRLEAIHCRNCLNRAAFLNKVQSLEIASIR